jgi:hypothetical protein
MKKACHAVGKIEETKHRIKTVDISIFYGLDKM